MRRLRREAPDSRNRLLNCTLDDVAFVPQIRKPFDVLTERLVSEESRGDRTLLELFLAGFATWDGLARNRIVVL